jgi:hypothetical protein
MQTQSRRLVLKDLLLIVLHSNCYPNSRIAGRRDYQEAYERRRTCQVVTMPISALFS